MGLLESVKESLTTRRLDRPKGPDFPEGFIIEEISNETRKVTLTVKLIGNMMPKQPFDYGGEQRLKKEYYSGHSEPVVQVLGPKESDFTIKGTLKDKRYKKDIIDNIPEGSSVSLEVQEQIDGIRIRGNLCRFRLGEWERYGYIEKTEFNMRRLAYIDYSITISNAGFNAPENAKFLQQKREVPFDINNELIEQANAFNEEYSNVPGSVPVGIADQIRLLVGEVAGAIATVTGFVDNVLSTVQDIQKAVFRAKGLIKHAQSKLKQYKKVVGAFDPFDPSQALTGRYENAKFYSSSIASGASLSSLMNRYRTQFNNLSSNLPLARHLVVEGDTLQKISIKYYGSSDNWKKIYDYNKLTTTELNTNSLLEIPRS